MFLPSASRQANYSLSTETLTEWQTSFGNTLSRRNRRERPVRDADEVAESKFKPYTNSVNDINAKLLAEISTRIENAVVFGDAVTQI